MSTYRLIVVRIDDNPAYDAEQAARVATEIERRQRHQYFGDTMPSYDVPRTVEARALDVVLEPAEYEAIKRAVVGTWA